MPHRSMWVSGADLIKIMDFLTEEGSNFEDFGEEKVGRDIDLFALALPRDLRSRPFLSQNISIFST